MSRKTTRKRKERVSDDDGTYVLSESEREGPVVDANVSTSSREISRAQESAEGQAVDNAWGEKVLEPPSKFIANVLTESIRAQWDDVRAVCESTVGRTLEELLGCTLSPNGFGFETDDVTPWWMQKWAAAVQDCFIDGVGETRTLPASATRQSFVDYGNLADVFEDLGTAPLPELDQMREAFIELDCMVPKCSSTASCYVDVFAYSVG